MTKFTTFICAAGLAFIVGCGQTDTGVTTSVQTRLASDDVVQARDIDVTTQDGVVTLSGEVQSQIEREQAIMIARQTDGVRDVVDQLRVSEAAPTTGFDDRRDFGDRQGEGVFDDSRDADRHELGIEPEHGRDTPPAP